MPWFPRCLHTYSSKVLQPLENCVWSLSSSAVFLRDFSFGVDKPQDLWRCGLAPTSFGKTMINTWSTCAAQAKLNMKTCWESHLHQKLATTFTQVVLHLFWHVFPLLTCDHCASAMKRMVNCLGVNFLKRMVNCSGVNFLGIYIGGGVFCRSSLFNTIIYQGSRCSTWLTMCVLACPTVYSQLKAFLVSGFLLTCCNCQKSRSGVLVGVGAETSYVGESMKGHNSAVTRDEVLPADRFFQTAEISGMTRRNLNSTRPFISGNMCCFGTRDRRLTKDHILICNFSRVCIDRTHQYTHQNSQQKDQQLWPTDSPRINSLQFSQIEVAGSVEHPVVELSRIMGSVFHSAETCWNHTSNQLAWDLITFFYCAYCISICIYIYNYIYIPRPTQEIGSMDVLGFRNDLQTPGFRIQWVEDSKPGVLSLNFLKIHEDPRVFLYPQLLNSLVLDLKPFSDVSLFDPLPSPSSAAFIHLHSRPKMPEWVFLENPGFGTKTCGEIWREVMYEMKPKVSWQKKTGLEGQGYFLA